MVTTNPALRNPPLRQLLLGALLFTLASALMPQQALAAAKLKIAKAVWSEKAGTLVIKGKAKDIGGPVEIYDINGRLLGEGQGPAFTLSVSRDALPAVPCAVRVEAGGLEVTQPVKGAPKACSNAPTCRITAPANEVAVKLGDPVTFTATAAFSNPQAKPQYEWDFAGGAMGEDDARNSAVESYKRATGTTATVKFVRDNSRYRVHFSAVDGSIAAMESKQYRCEDTVEIVVGSPPTDVPDMTAMVNAAQQSAPKVAKDKNGNPTGKKGDLVVLPYEDLTMQCTDDARLTPASSVANETRYGNLNAVVYQKDLKPPQRTDVTLRYAAASNPNDPVGSGSINSTSQNWPLPSDIRAAASPFMDSTIRKTDRWEPGVIGGTDLQFFISFGLYPVTGTPDEGFTVMADPNNLYQWPASVPYTLFDSEHGRRMPGFDAPYAANTAQDFTGYFNELNAYQARWLPLTDTDDSGKVNPFPLLRVQAFEPGGSNPVATTDAVQTAGRDFHCRECHAKGRIGADPNVPWQPGAMNYSARNPNINGFGGWETDPFGKAFAPPAFFDAVDANGQPSADVFDQEFAALRNMTNLHDFYDRLGFTIYGTDFKGSIPCGNNCHIDNNNWRSAQFPSIRYGAADPEQPFPMPTTSAYSYDTNYSMNMHKWHGQLQYNGGKDGVLRDDKGVPQRWDAAKGYNVNTLFPVKNLATGEILPMEQNCLKCHAGQREQCYRDRMFTAGVTCYQCHGDMLAVGKAYPKKAPGSDGHKLRADWYDQPDCGSCHVGSANVGKADPEFFSAAVRRLAFEKDDLSATTRPVDWSNPDASRFAVPVTPVTVPIFDVTSIPTSTVWMPNILRQDGPLYRMAKDTHGNVPCAACHGGAHAVWPNRDPNANDNVTALELQGHTGTITECNVCHDENAFKAEADLDGSAVYSHDPKPGILGGPHNTHPINDPYWWKSTEGDSANADGTTYGGWHNNYAKKSGKADEDQCAACHGNDHKGTRLSRTPVDRVFDFSGFNMAKLKKAGVKKKVIKVPAGSFIGCDTCHSLPTSCIGSPAGDQCGKASEVTTPSTNQPPVFTAEPGTDATNFTYGQSAPYSYTAKANDPDGDALTFGLSTRLDAMSIDADTGTVTVSDWNAVTKGFFDLGQQLPYTYTYIVTVTDGKGGTATQRVPVTIVCPSGQVWGYDPVKAAKACLANTPPTLEVPLLPAAAVGGAFTVTVSSTDPDRNGNVQSPLYMLNGQPESMTLGQTNGVLNWTPTTAGTYTLTITVSDQAGGTDSKTITLHVCEAGQTWSEGAAACVVNHSPTITSTPPATAYAKQPYSYAVEASDADGDALQFSLSGAPAGMSFTGSTLNWTPTDADAATGSFNLTVVVTDGKGGIATQTLALHICPTGQKWDGGMGMCM